MWNESDINLIINLVKDFKLTLPEILHHPLKPYEIELISKRYRVEEFYINNVLNKVYNKKINSLKKLKELI